MMQCKKFSPLLLLKIALALRENNRPLNLRIQNKLLCPQKCMTTSSYLSASQCKPQNQNDQHFGPASSVVILVRRWRQGKANYRARREAGETGTGQWHWRAKESLNQESGDPEEVSVMRASISQDLTWVLYKYRLVSWLCVLINLYNGRSI
jgi:hypothetical protein